MRQLLLLRHAKSSWDDGFASDFDRVLAPRGQRAILVMSTYIKQQGLEPDKVICSTATRAQQTWAAAHRILAGTPKVIDTEKLYLASAETMLNLIKKHGGNASKLMLVGHNPGIHDLALELCGSGDVALREALSLKFPTAAFAVIGFPSQWKSVTFGSGKLLNYTCPKDLV